jgi:hypothetical protein
MQISGRIIILTAFAVALALSGGAWWYQYEASNRAAKFWGPTGARLLMKAPRVEFLELGQPDEAAEGATLARRPVVAEHDLSDKQGLVHLRFVFTQDAYFLWGGRRHLPIEADRDWDYALRFVEGDRTLVVLLARDFKQIGRLEGDHVDVLPSPRIAASVIKYLTDVGVLDFAAAAR